MRLNTYFFYIFVLKIRVYLSRKEEIIMQSNEFIKKQIKSLILGADPKGCFEL